MPKKVLFLLSSFEMSKKNIFLQIEFLPDFHGFWIYIANYLNKTVFQSHAAFVFWYAKMTCVAVKISKVRISFRIYGHTRIISSKMSIPWTLNRFLKKTEARVRNYTFGIRRSNRNILTVVFCNNAKKYLLKYSL